MFFMAIKFTILLFMLSFSTFARERVKNQALVCLGQEEERLHKAKNVGAIYQFNQKMISELIMLKHVTLKPEFVDQICKAKIPSLEFFTLLSEHSREIFNIEGNLPKNFMMMGQAHIDDLEDRIPDLFNELITIMQSLSDYPHCLKEEIPELESYFYQRTYLEEDISIKEWLKQKKLVPQVARKLKNMDKILKSCEAKAARWKKKNQSDGESKK
jgi:hypothetical protein